MIFHLHAWGSPSALGCASARVTKVWYGHAKPFCGFVVARLYHLMQRPPRVMARQMQRPRVTEGPVGLHRCVHAYAWACLFQCFSVTTLRLACVRPCAAVMSGGRKVNRTKSYDMHTQQSTKIEPPRFLFASRA